MARIPMPNFGNAVPDAPPMMQPAAGAFGGGVADALQQIGNQGMRLAEDMRQQNMAMGRAQAANAMLDHEIAVKTATADIHNRIQTGELPYGQANNAFQDTISKITIPKIDNADPVTQENLARGVERLNFQQQTVIQGSVQAARRDDFKGQYGMALDKLGKLGNLPGANVAEINAKAEAFTPLAKQAGINDAVVAKTLQDFKDQNWTNHATQTAIENRDNLDGLLKLSGDLTKADGYYADKLDTNKRNAILSGVETHILMLQRRAGALVDKADAQAERINDKLEADMMTGIPVSENRLANDAQFVKNLPDQQERFNGILEMGKEVRRILSLPPAEQQHMLDSMRADLTSKGADYPVRQKKLLDTMTAVHDNFTKTLKDEPLQAIALRTGHQFTPLTAAAMTDPTKIPAIFADREAWAMAAKKQYGPDVQPRLLFSAEAEMVKGMLNGPTATPEYQRKFLGILKGTMSGEAFRATMDQIGADPVMKMAGEAEAGNLHTMQLDGGAATNGRPLSQMLLEGKKLLTDKTTLMPKDKGTGGDAIAPAFNEYVGDALPRGDKSSQDAYAGVHAVYAVLAKEAGKNDGILAPDILQQAIRIVTGGVVDHGGVKVIPPYGMTESQFNDKLLEQIDATKGRTSLTPDELWRLPLESAAGKDNYVFKNGRSYVPGLDGKPLTVNLGTPVPGAAPAKPAAVPPAPAKKPEGNVPFNPFWTGGKK